MAPPVRPPAKPLEKPFPAVVSGVTLSATFWVVDWKRVRGALMRTGRMLRAATRRVVRAAIILMEGEGFGW